MKRFLKIGAILLGCLLVIFGLLSYTVLPNLIIKTIPRNCVGETPADHGLEYENVTILTKDGLKLRGFYTPSAIDTTLGAVIILHGHNSCKESQLRTVSALANEGFQTFAYDARAHGESEGSDCTFGYFEKDDVSKVVDYLQSEKGIQNIALWGTSYGGAVGLQALEYDERLKCGIIQCTFSSLSDIVYDYSIDMFGFGLRWLSDFTLEVGGKQANFDPEQVRPSESAKNIEQPTLISHGDADYKIDVSYGKLNYENLQSTEKELIIVEGAGHTNLFHNGTEELRKRTLDFLKKHI